MSYSKQTLQLGAFSVSLAVKNIEVSKIFYQKLGFTIIGGEQSQNWIILRNGDTTIGLFQGMFEGNVMTFNPGWDSQNNNLDEFKDVRAIHQQLIDAGIETTDVNLGNTNPSDDSGPGHISFVDPDGNAILIDQHV